MKITAAVKMVGKIVEFENGMQLLLMSGGIGNHTTYVFQRPDTETEWSQMDMQEALPYVLEIARTVMREMSN